MFIFDGCLKPEEYQPYPADNIVHTGENRYGRELEDPHAIHNIRRALESLKAAGVPVPAEAIIPNHTYLRFLPASELEMSLLENDSTLVLFDHPLNYEFAGVGSDVDPGYENSHPEWLYCVVPSGKNLPAVRYEVIYEVFIPTVQDYTTRSTAEGITGSTMISSMNRRG
jgi:hypothetical protein